MNRRLATALLGTAAALLAAAPLLHPAFNPDLFWHLSAGRFLLAHRALPPSDFLTFAPPAVPWLDFEWLSQAVFAALFAAGGFWALWLWKLAVLAAAAGCLLAALRRAGVTAPFLAGALALWSAGALTYADVRPELWSVLFFCALLAVLESRRARGFAFGPLGLAALFAGFALWSNLHAGFPAGLAALAAYALVEGALGRRRSAAALGRAFLAAALGTLVNPFGPGVWRVLAAHWSEGAALSASILEWQALTNFLASPVHWPLFALLALVAAVLALRARPRAAALPWGAALCAAGLGLATLARARAAAYFDAAAVLFVFLAAKEAGWLARPAARLVLIGGLALDAAFTAWLAPRMSWAGPFDPANVPVAAAEFLARERAAVERLRILNQWQWGGYLGWRLAPWCRVFDDGRYVFHERLEPLAAAQSSPSAWRAFVDGWKLDGVLVPNSEVMEAGDPPRPWYILYMPEARWALVYWDAQAVFFARREAVPPAWLAAHEYKWWRPHDAPYLRALRLAGRLPEAALAAERDRQARETAGR